MNTAETPPTHPHDARTAHPSPAGNGISIITTHFGPSQVGIPGGQVSDLKNRIKMLRVPKQFKIFGRGLRVAISKILEFVLRPHEEAD
jgi:hypothetical protein